MDSREDFPRVSLATVSDWDSVKANYKSTVLDVIHEHIQAHGIAAERDALLAHANQYVERVFEMAQPNLRINGHNFGSLEYNTEPFDEALDRRIWSLADTRLQWQKRIAETRRTLPKELEGTILDLLNEQRNIDAEATEALHTEVIEDTEADDVDGMQADLNLQHQFYLHLLELLSRHSHVEEGFQKTVALGKELDQACPSPSSCHSF
ncbi:hypothetical protein C0992_010130 [Termitomyces sp. T32_za158]|nr:hypothetical protein C0992_010130 [Termitomyces sp. T32_za158]